MQFELYQRFLSKPRMSRFLIVANQNVGMATKFYEHNLAVSQSFYPLIHFFEVFFRNALNEKFTHYFGNPNWMVEQKRGFMAADSLTASHFYLRECVGKAERTLLKKGKRISSGNLLAEQQFGFWTSFFETHHYKLLKGRPMHIFPLKPKHLGRKEVSQKLNRIRALRNRIYHQEPICFLGSVRNYDHAGLVKTDIYDLLNWMHHDLATYVEQFDSIVFE